MLLFSIWTVLDQITQPPQSMNVTTGDMANFSCSVSSGVAVQWRIDSEDYPMCTDGKGSSICFSNKKEDTGMISTLNIPDTGVLGEGTYTISCVVPQLINESFRSDPSFEYSFNQWNESATFTITNPPGDLLSL